jgi:Mrp family chromosome partitioning ATPase
MIDPVTMSKTADGVVLVALANVTPRQQLKRAHMFLETAGANVLGVIVNQWKNPIV